MLSSLMKNVVSMKLSPGRSNSPMIEASWSFCFSALAAEAAAATARGTNLPMAIGWGLNKSVALPISYSSKLFKN